MMIMVIVEMIIVGFCEDDDNMIKGFDDNDDDDEDKGGCMKKRIHFSRNLMTMFLITWFKKKYFSHCTFYKKEYNIQYLPR